MSVEELIEQSNQQEVSRFKDSISRYLRKWPWLILSVIIAILMAYFYLKFKPNQYLVKSKLQINKTNQVQDPSELLFGNRMSSRSFSGLTDEIIVFTSFPIVRAALETLNFDVSYFLKDGLKTKEIYKKSPIRLVYNRSAGNRIPFNLPFEIKLIDESNFEIKSEESFLDGVLEQEGRYGETIEFGAFSFTIVKTIFFSEFEDYEIPIIIQLNDLDRLTYSYQKRLDFEEMEKFTSILTMTIQTTIPEKSIDFLNTLTDIYIEQNLIDKNEVSKNTVEFIDQQLAIISDSLNKKENNLASFKAKESRAELSVEGSMIAERFNDLESEKAKYEVMQQYYDYLQTNLQSGDGQQIQNLIAPSAFGIQDAIINELVKNLIELNFNESKLLEDGNTKSPLLNQIKNRKKDLINALEESIDNLSRANKIILNDLKNRGNDLSLKAQKLPDSERKLVSLNRLLQLNENIYLFLMEKRSSAAIKMSSNTSDCKVIEPAMLNPTSPIAPNRKMAYMIAIVLGIFLPLSIIILKDFLNDKVQDIGDIEANSSVSIMGTIPSVTTISRDFIVFDQPKSSLAESFRTMRANLSFYQKKQFPFVILVTSTVAKEGKTFCAINLASTLAASGKKTILIGLDLRKPQIHNYLNVENIDGVSNYLAGNVSLENAVKPTRHSNLYIMVSGAIPPNPAELINTSKTFELISNLKKEFDYIVLDTPPVGLVADALILQQYADLNLYMIRQNYSKKEFVSQAEQLHRNSKLANLSFIHNDVDKSANHKYGYYEENNTSSRKRIFGNLKRT